MCWHAADLGSCLLFVRRRLGCRPRRRSRLRWPDFMRGLAERRLLYSDTPELMAEPRDGGSNVA